MESLRDAVDVWKVRSRRETLVVGKRQSRVGNVTTGLTVRVPCSAGGAVGLGVSAVDVPGMGDCLYHAAWQAASRVGVDRPFGLGPYDSVFDLRVLVGERVAELVADGKVGAVSDPALEFIGGEEVDDPIVVYHCSVQNIQAYRSFDQRNHYAAVVLDPDNMLLLKTMVAAHRAAAPMPIAIDDIDPREPVHSARQSGASATGGSHLDDGEGRKAGMCGATSEMSVQSTTGSDAKCPAYGELSPGDAAWLNALSDASIALVDVKNDDIRKLAAGQKYTSCPKLALLYYHCCSNDPTAHVFNDERLLGAGASDTLRRVEAALDAPVGQEEVEQAGRRVEQRLGTSKDIHACASCCEVLHDSEAGIVKVPLHELPNGFLLTEEEVDRMSRIPKSFRSSNLQVLEYGASYYHLNPDLVPDIDEVVLCHGCHKDPRSMRFSIACGHDYGRPGYLPVLNDIASNCISPVRRFGSELLLSGKHTSGHTICFPSDGPVECAKVLPWVDVDVLPRVTFIGAESVWRAKKNVYRKLYELPTDDIYSWLRVLQHTHSGFRDSGIAVKDTPSLRKKLVDLEQYVEESIVCTESEHMDAVDECVRAERYGTDAVAATEGDGLLVTRGAVLKNVTPGAECDGESVAVDTLLRLIDDEEASKKSNVVSVTRAADPVVEWCGNGETIAAVFPQLCMRGGSVLPDGTWGAPLIRHLMRYYDGRFEQNTRFVAMLFNQMQRHAAVKRAAKLGSSHARVLERFGALVNSDEFRERLVAAKKSPGLAESRRLNASLLRVLSLVGGCVPFSPFERAAARPKIGALRCRYGVPQHWVTVAPPEHDNAVLHRIAMIRKCRAWNVHGSIYASGKCTHDDLPEDIRSSARARLMISNQYPALAVQVFERCVRAIFDDIVMCPSSTDTRLSRSYVERESGAYGKVAAQCSVVEAQVDGRLHIHSLLYGSAYTPELLTRISCCPKLRAKAAQWLESVCTTQLRDETHSWRSGFSKDGKKLPRAYEIELASSTPDGFFSSAEKRAATTNFHSHSATCYKGARGKYMCRLARPAGTFTDNTQPLLVQRLAHGDYSKGTRPKLVGQPLEAGICAAIDKGYDTEQGNLFAAQLRGPILWEMKRPSRDEMFVETNLVLAGLTACHTNSTMVNGEDSGDMVEQYQQAYMTKDEPGLRNAIPVLITAVDHTLAHPSRAADADTDIRKGKYLATRTVNAFTGAHEWSHTTMVYALCGHRSFVSSDTFWYVFPYHLVTAVRAVVARGRDNDLEEEQMDDGAGEDDLRSEDVDVELETLVAMANNDSHAQAGNSVGDTGAGARSFRVEDRVVFVTQAESYQHRGTLFADYSPMEFECIVDVVAVGGAGETQVQSRGRPRRKQFPFATTHPLYGHYVGCIRMKMHTPIFGGRQPPRWIEGTDEKASKSRDALAEYVIAVFTPWGRAKPAHSLDQQGLLDLCRDWDRKGASLINRQRVRSIRNLIKQGYRSSHNEQVITEWRNRNVDLWSTIRAQSATRSDVPRESMDVDLERLGVLSNTVDMFELAVAVASRETRVQAQLRKMDSMLSSIMLVDSTQDLPPLQNDQAMGLHQPSFGSEPLKRLASRLRSLTKTPSVPCDVTQGGSRVHDPLGGQAQSSPDVADLSPEQAAVVERVLSGDRAGHPTLTLLHGGGGTGKSHVIRQITEELASRGREVVNTCTTGAGAVQLVNGRTLHSALKCHRGGNVTTKAHAEMKLLFGPKISLVVVDEVSMLGAALLVLMDERLRGLYDPTKAFGGISVMLVGDFWQLEVIGSIPLCNLLYEDSTKAMIKAKLLFSQFRVMFLTRQQRASGCLAQQQWLEVFRSMPLAYPNPQNWNFTPLTDKLVDWLTRPLTREDVMVDPKWIENSVILVTSNRDRAAFNTLMAKILSARTGKLLFRWRKTISERSRSRLGPAEALIYSEDDRPYLFGYFYSGARGQILDNGNGNVQLGVANGSPCVYHSIAWDDPRKTARVAELIKRAEESNERIVELPFPPEFINVLLLDRDCKPVSRKSWPLTENVISGDSTSAGVVIPIGVVTSNGDRFKLALKSSGNVVFVQYDQHAVDLALAMTVWKAQGSTFDRVILQLEGSGGSPAWKFEHLYVAASRVRAADHLRCIPLTRPRTRMSLLSKTPEVSTVRWRMDIGADGLWYSRCPQPATSVSKRQLETPVDSSRPSKRCG